LVTSAFFATIVANRIYAGVFLVFNSVVYWGYKSTVYFSQGQNKIEYVFKKNRKYDFSFSL